MADCTFNIVSKLNNINNDTSIPYPISLAHLHMIHYHCTISVVLTERVHRRKKRRGKVTRAVAV